MPVYVLNDEKMFSDIADGIAIIINSETGIYYGMNEFGTLVFENMLNGASTENILAAISQMQGAPMDIGARLNAFVGVILEKELMVEGEGGGTVNLDAEIARAGDFIFEIKEYTDAQELLLADPIHEVKEATGWNPEKDALETDEEVIKVKESKVQR